MKVFIACLGTETNTFSSMPTGLQTFEDTMLFRGDATRHPASAFSLPLHVWRKAAEERQGQVVESLAAFAQPAGLTIRKVYEGFRDEILDDLRAAMPVDIVLLSMHGAMTAEGYEDCEGGPARPRAPDRRAGCRSRRRAGPPLLDHAEDGRERGCAGHLQGISAYRRRRTRGRAVRYLPRRPPGRRETGHGRPRLPDGRYVAHARGAGAGPGRGHAGGRGQVRHPLRLLRARLPLAGRA